MPPLERDADVVVVGAGLAGLACARRLAAARLRCLLLDAADEVGGRVRTDRIGGFLLDRGFQVLPTAAPEAQAVLDYAALDLKPFAPEAWVRHAGRFRRVSDPWRTPVRWPAMLLSPIGTLGDKWRLKALRERLLAPGARPATPEITTLDYLRAAGLSDVLLDRFMRPFFGGILLDRDLGVSARAFEPVFRWMALGEAALPAAGMGEIPRQIAARLGPEVVRLGARVASVAPGRAALASPAGGASNGAELLARAVVVATEAPEAARLLGPQFDRPSVGVTCLHFAAAEAPFSEPLLVLNADAGEGPIHNLAVASNVAPGYAPEGEALVVATVLGAGSLGGPAVETAVRRQMESWFGDRAGAWRLLRLDRIAHAHPSQRPPALEPPQRPVRVAPGLYVCGDHRDQASINGALASGRRAAEAVIADLGG